MNRKLKYGIVMEWTLVSLLV